ncbi:MAG: helix-turn-helix transcriptional regulator [Cyclobacteriaceae bacterium]
MKQPDLGHKIAELRKSKNLTQEELVDACNVSVRTIQRIESGEVTPRTSTVKILLAALGEDFQSFKSEISGSQSGGSLASLESWLNAAWISGIVYFMLGFLDAALEYGRFESGDVDTYTMFYISTKVLYLSSYILFMLGLIRLSGYFGNYLLRVSAYLMIGIFIYMTAFDIASLYFEISDHNLLFVGAGESMTVGVIGMLIGIGLIRLQDGMGVLAKTAGIMEIAAGFFFLLVIFFWLGYILLIPATILEIILLFKASDFIRSERNNT